MGDDHFELTVATYNARLGIQQGLGAIADVLRAHSRPDVVAIQELGDQWTMGPEGDSTRRLAELLDYSHFVFVPTIKQTRPASQAARYGHALLCDRPVVDQQIVALPRGDDEPRAMLHSTLEWGSATIEVLSTHLSHMGPDRRRQGTFLLDWLEASDRKGDARFLLGDLNAPPSEPWMRRLLSRWTDADADAQRPTFPAHAPERRIDYVLAQGADLTASAVPSEIEASDHRPLVSRWTISTTGASP